MPPPILTTIGKTNYLPKISHLFARAFNTDPLHRAIMLHESHNTKVDKTSTLRFSHESWVEHWLANTTRKIADGGEIIEAGNWAAAAIWFPPNPSPSPLPSSQQSSFNHKTTTPPAQEYHDKFERLKERYLGHQTPFWYLDLIGRDPSRSEKGAIRALLEPYLKQASQAGIPVWLEATNEHARDVYVHFGFRTVEEVIIGKGSLDWKGDLVKGGEGVVMYGMIAEPTREREREREMSIL